MEILVLFYTLALKNLDKNSMAYADVLYRRGGAYERLKNYDLADKDLLNSIKIRPDEPYTLNYLAYSWLERGYKIEEAIPIFLLKEKSWDLNSQHSVQDINIQIPSHLYGKHNTQVLNTNSASSICNTEI